jgi:hypothetical protein
MQLTGQESAEMDKEEQNVETYFSVQCQAICSTCVNNGGSMLMFKVRCRSSDQSCGVHFSFD